MIHEPTDVWIGLKPCGCCVAVIVNHSTTDGIPKAMSDAGLTTQLIPWRTWREDYRHTMMERCIHE